MGTSHQFTKSLRFTESKQKMKQFVGLAVFLLAFGAAQASNLKGVKEREWGMSGCDGQKSDGDKYYTWTDWTEWSDCSVSCGGTGEKTRTRDCVDPSTVDWNSQAPTKPRLTLATPLPAGQSSLSGPPARACAEAPGVSPGPGLASSQPRE